MLRALRSGGLVGLAFVGGIMGDARAADHCSAALNQGGNDHLAKQVTAETLVGLRDIGPIYRADPARSILALSPNKDSVAFQIQRGDAGTNKHCVALVVLPLRAGSAAAIVDTADELIMDAAPAFGWASFHVGVPAPVTPRWAPSGEWVAYLKRVDHSTQIWIVDLASKRVRQVTHADVDVEDFRITDDGSMIVYQTRPALHDNMKMIDFEGLRGWRYDSRWLPIKNARPQSPDAAQTYTAVVIDDGTERPATEAETATFARPTSVPPEAPAFMTGPNKRKAWIEPVSGSPFPPDNALVVEDRMGKITVCSATVCKPDGWTSLWWTDDGSRLRFARREGWANSVTAIYEWAPGKTKPRRLYQTSDALIECQPVGDDLLCLRERSRVPRHLVRISFDDHREITLFRSNPDYGSLKQGKVKRLNWRNDWGVEFYGDLVYPVKFREGVRSPLVVVQYRTRGFLRGGVGDEVPIQALANRGYFVLVVDIRDAEAIVGRKTTAAALQTAYDRDFVGQRNILSAIETSVRSLVDQGLVDAKRIGIAGLSAGSITVQFAALNSSMFAAGSVSGCCLEPTQDAFLGPMISARYHEAGWPKLANRDDAFWSKISLIMQPERVQFPLLFQAADSEYLAALGSFVSMSQAGVPTDLFVFPGEHHIKQQPAHQLAVYKRNLAWFDFWLRDVLPEDPVEREEAVRWSEMKGRWLRDDASKRH